ncbi:MAG: hypothetical protein H0U23_00750 [Blastocatellia bacterium]|nr:hypothetical protein [Blastocatellia bacterium]
MKNKLLPRGDTTKFVPEETPSEIIDAHVESLREKHPVLFIGGPNATEAMRQVVQDVTEAMGKIVAISLHDRGQEIQKSMTLLLEGEFADLSRPGAVTTECIDALYERPVETILAIVKSTHGFVLAGLEMVAVEGISIIPDEPETTEEDDIFNIDNMYVQKVRGQA